MPALVVLEGPNRGAVLRLLHGANRIGRDPAAEVALPDERASRLHAEIELDGAGARIADRGSRNATFLNGVRLGDPAALAHGDEVRVGGTVLLYVDESTAPPAGAGGGCGGEPDPRLDTATMPSVASKSARTASAAVEAAPPLGAGALATSAAARGARVEAGASPRYLIGDSEPMRRTAEVVRRLAPLDTTVLIRGETGTGKELVAEALHRLSRRRGPLLAVNCATLAPMLLESELFGHERGAFTGAVARRLGKLELASGGTLFLDEVAELTPEAQAKLLRAIDTRRFPRLGGHEELTSDARLVAATHQELDALIRDGRFREDLAFRLRVVEVTLPPLRERPDDLPALVDHFVAVLRRRIPARARGLSERALDVLRRYRFPGNVRELKNLVERALIFADGEAIEPDDLPGEVRAAAGFVPASAPASAPPSAPAAESAPGNGGESFPTLAELERAHIERALERAAGNKTRAAELLGIDRNTLYAKRKRHGAAP
jgi:DNA-binding NtrC family response regulator